MSTLRKAALFTTLLSATLLAPVSALAAVPDYSSNISSLVAYLQANQDATGKITGFGGETSWTVMGLAAVGIDPHTVQNGGVSLVDFLKNNPPIDTATTGWERDLLAVTAAGENPFTFGGRNYVAKVQSFASSNQIGSTTLLNDDIFGILSLISAGPSANQTIISDSVNFLIANQNADHGWSFQVSGASDTNDTAVAVEALKAAQDKGFSNTGLDDAIDTGTAYLLGLQQTNGGWEYQSGFGTDGASTAWVVQAVLGNDSEVEDGLNFLVSLQDTSGGVQYQAGFGADTFTSGYALNAFAQKAFPVGEFTGTFTQPSTNPGDNQNSNDQNNQDQNQNNQDNQNQSINTSQNNNKQGQVLAASILPDTGIAPSLDSLVPTLDYKNEPIKINYFLLASLIALEAGLVLRLVASRLEKNTVG